MKVGQKYKISYREVVGYGRIRYKGPEKLYYLGSALFTDLPNQDEHAVKFNSEYSHKYKSSSEIAVLTRRITSLEPVNDYMSFIRSNKIPCLINGTIEQKIKHALDYWNFCDYFDPADYMYPGIILYV